MAEDSDKYIRRELGKISDALVQLAKQDQKIVSLLERQDRTDREVYALRQEVSGPEGLRVKLERNTVKLALICTATSAISASIFTTALKFFIL